MADDFKLDLSGLPDKGEDTGDSVQLLEKQNNQSDVLLDFSNLPDDPDDDYLKGYGKGQTFFRAQRPDEFTRGLTTKEKAGIQARRDRKLYDELPPHAKFDVIAEGIASKALPYLITAPIAPLIYPWLLGFEALGQGKGVAVPLIKGEGLVGYSPLEDRKFKELAQPLINDIPDRPPDELMPDPPLYWHAVPQVWLYMKASQWIHNNPREATDISMTLGEAVLDYVIVSKGVKGFKEVEKLFKMPENVKSAYDTLGVSPNTKTADINKVFRKKQLKFHPDRTGGGDKKAFQELNNANATIKNYRAGKVQRLMDIFRKPVEQRTQAERALIASLGGKESVTPEAVAQGLGLEVTASPLITLAKESASAGKFLQVIADSENFAGLAVQLGLNQDKLVGLYNSCQPIGVSATGQSVDEALAKAEDTGVTVETFDSTRFKSAEEQALWENIQAKDLREEAKTFDTAEEFVKAQRDKVLEDPSTNYVSKGKDVLGRDIPDWRNAKVYHSTSQAGHKSIKEGGFRTDLGDEQGGYYGKAISFTPSLDYTRQFGEVITESKISPNAKILNLNDPKDAKVFDSIMKGKTWGMDMHKEFLDAGYDGVYDAGAGDLFIYNPEVVQYTGVANVPKAKSEKELTDIWNKAKAEAPKVKAPVVKIPKALQPIADIAKNYKTAKEFLLDMTRYDGKEWVGWSDNLNPKDLEAIKDSILKKLSAKTGIPFELLKVGKVDKAMQTALDKAGMTQKDLAKEVRKVQNKHLTDIWKQAHGKAPAVKAPEAKALKVDRIKVKDTPERARAVGMSKAKWEALEKDIKANGVRVPIIMDSETGQVLDGHKRLTVAESLGIKDVPVVRVSGKTRKEIEQLNKELTDIAKAKAPEKKAPELTQRQRVRKNQKQALQDKVDKLSKRLAKASGSKAKANIKKQLEEAQQAVSEFEARNKLKQTIIANQTVKGFPATQINDIVKNVTDGKVASLANKNLTVEELQKVLDKVRKARPRRIKGKVVITKQTEKRIGELKQTLMDRGELTEQDYKNILEAHKVREPFFRSQNSFTTETQAKEVIKSMLQSAPANRSIVGAEKAVSKIPTIKGIIDKWKGIFEKQFGGKKAVANPAIDIHHYVDQLQKQTGIPFGTVWESLNNKRQEVIRQIGDVLERPIIACGGMAEFDKIRSDPEALARVEQYIQSQLPKYYKGVPKKPVDITPQEEALAKEISKVLKELEGAVRYNRFYEWYENGVPIPNAPASELRKASQILETKGDEALRAWLEGRSWGTIRSGYDIGYVLQPSVKTFVPKPAKVGVAKIRPREDLVVRKYDKDILARFTSYVRQMILKTELRQDVNSWVNMVNTNLGAFADPEKVTANITSNVLEILGRRDPPEAIENFVIGLWRQGARAVFLDPKKGFRNMLQNPAMYPDTVDLLRLPTLIKAMSPEDREYFETFVSQDRGIKLDFFMQDTNFIAELRASASKIARLGGQIMRPLEYLNELADSVNVMGRTDTLNRLVAFKARLGRCRRAFKKYPNWKSDPKQLEKLMKDSGLGDLEPLERIHALVELAKFGENAYSRFVARGITQNVHFLYERAQRMPMAQGGAVARIFTNLLVFRRGTFQRLTQATIRGFAPSQRELNQAVGGGRRALRTLLTVTVGAYFVGEMYKLITGDKRNPYRVDNIIGNLSLGGLATGAQEQIGDFTRYTVLAVQGDKTALSQVENSIVDSADFFIPFYDEVFNTVEGFAGYKDLDKAVLRQLRQKLDKRIKTKSLDEWKVIRDNLESGQHILFGTEPQEDKPKAGAEIGGR